MKLYAIGEYLIDFLSLDEINYQANPGGAPANVSACVSLLGEKSTLISSIGNDNFKEHLVSTLQSCNVDTTNISVINNKNTMLAFVKIDENNEREFSFYRDNTADLFLDINKINEISFNKDILHFCSVSLNNENNIKAHQTAINKIKEKKGFVSFDANLRFNLWNDVDRLKNISYEFMKQSDIIKLSDDELLFLTNTNNEKDALNKLNEIPFKLLFITRGKDGASSYTKESSYHNQGIKVNTVDTTGAGDAFVGAILYKIINEKLDIDNLSLKELKDITDYAVSFSALSTTINGAIPAYKAITKNN